MDVIRLYGAFMEHNRETPETAYISFRKKVQWQIDFLVIERLTHRANTWNHKKKKCLNRRK